MERKVGLSSTFSPRTKTQANVITTQKNNAVFKFFLRVTQNGEWAYINFYLSEKAKILSVH